MDHSSHREDDGERGGHIPQSWHQEKKKLPTSCYIVKKGGKDNDSKLNPGGKRGLPVKEEAFVNVQGGK